MKELSKSFPDGLHYQIVYDTTPFISESVNEVFKTLRGRSGSIGGHRCPVVLAGLAGHDSPMIDVAGVADWHPSA